MQTSTVRPMTDAERRDYIAFAEQNARAWMRRARQARAQRAAWPHLNPNTVSGRPGYYVELARHFNHVAIRQRRQLRQRPLF